MGTSTKSTTATKSVAHTRYTIADIEPLTDSQKKFFDAYKHDFNLLLSGAAGTGKTFISIYAALKQVIASKYKQSLVIVRSAVPTRDMGFLPGTMEEKEAAYTLPYVSIVNKLCKDGKAWENLTKTGSIRFITTSYVRGITLDDSIVLVDEWENMDGAELDSIITRLGENSRVIFCGDFEQCDFRKEWEKKGTDKFIEIIERLNYFKHIKFTWDDCVRSGLVRDYLMTKTTMGIKF